MADTDNYLPCDAYQGSPDSDAFPGFTVFQSDSTGLHYFSMVDKNGHIVLKSEGYDSAASRDEGITSVLQNRDTEERWTKGKDDEGYFMSLHTETGKEIARTCYFGSEGAMLGWWMPFAAEMLAFGHADEDKSIALPNFTEMPPAGLTKEQKNMERENVPPPMTPSEAATRETAHINKHGWKWLLGLILLACLLWLVLCGFDNQEKMTDTSEQNGATKNHLKESVATKR